MFFDLLIHKINRCSILKKMYVEENYKDEIFSIGNDLKDLKEDLKEVVKGLGSSVLEEYQHELDQIKKNIENFKPKTAYDTLIELEKRISSRGNLNSNISSRISYLKALCLSELNDFDAASKCSIEAYRIDSTNVEYRERAAVAYLNLGYKDEAFDLATNIISNQNPLNERANAILFIKGLEEGEDFHTSYKEMKELIKEGTRFKIAVSNYLIKQGKQELIFALFQKELLKIKPTEEIIYTNKDFWSIYSQLMDASAALLPNFVTELMVKTLLYILFDTY